MQEIHYDLMKNLLHAEDFPMVENTTNSFI